MELRRATISDTETLIRLRIAFLTDGGYRSEGEDLAALEERLRAYFESAIPTGEFAAVFAEEAGEIASVAYLSVSRRYSRRVEAIVPCGMIYNVFTPVAYRRRGLATLVLKELLRISEELDLDSVELLASEAGKPLYEKLGFAEPSHTYMVKRMK